MPETAFRLLFTAEHASHAIPARYGDVARRAGAVLITHRGYDPGTAELTRKLARAFKAPHLLGRHSRLLIELNRSPHHPRLWSEFSVSLNPSQKQELLTGYYQLYRDAVTRQIQRLSTGVRRVLHIGVHSFTPEFNREMRRADIGLLYDPARASERAFCVRWQAALEERPDGLRVRRNYPYRGVADGLVTHLRQQFGAKRYVGIELEVNQSFPLGPVRRWRQTQNLIVHSLAETVWGYELMDGHR